MEGRGGTLAQFGLYGPQASQALVAAGAADPNDLPLFAWRSVTIAGADVTVQRVEGVGSQSYTVLVPAPASNAVRTALLRGGAVPLGEDAYHVLRVEGGVPAPGHELTEHVNPLEAGLRRFCDDHKGCYTGQEIIARQITYDKVTTHLVGLLPERAVAAEAPIQVEGRQVGSVSSAVHSIALDRPIALGFVRRPHHEPGAEVTITVNGAPVPAIVCALPFIT
jgi:folate-binding protein YgfZ